MNYGLVEKLQEFSAYILGSSTVPYIPYQEDGNWEPFLPRYESQSDRFETYCCTIWGLQNQIETLTKRLYGDEPNYSERFTALLCNMDGIHGTDPQIPYESVRHDGLVDDRIMPMTDTKEEFFDPGGITGSLRAKGLNWLYRHDFQHEWLWRSATNRPANYFEILREALKTCPVGVSVTAWREVNGEYVSDAGGNNHWVMLYKIDEEGYPWVFDSYNHSKKKLSKNHNIRRAKRIWINKKTNAALKKHKSILTAIVERLFMQRTLLSVCQDNLGKDVTPSDLVPDMVACADTVTTLIRIVDPSFPLVSGTWTLYDILEHRKDYQKVSEPSPETIIISPTGMGNGTMSGHVGIIMEDGVIASNDSNSGRFLKNYTLDTWRRRYVNHGDLPVLMYKKI
jgi:hypothetical protein